MKKYILKTPVKFLDGIRQVGETVELDEKAAGELIEIGALEEVADSTTAAPTDSAARLAAILSAINQLDQEDAALWLKDGRPNTAVLEQVLGWKVAAAERDTAYTDWKTAQGAQD
jgi:hypothetical protein